MPMGHNNPFSNNEQREYNSFSNNQQLSTYQHQHHNNPFSNNQQINSYQHHETISILSENGTDVSHVSVSSFGNINTTLINIIHNYK